MEQCSNKPGLAKMRQIVEDRLAPLLSIDPTTPLTPQQFETLRNVIDDVRVLFHCLADQDDRLQALRNQSLLSQTLYELFIEHPDKDPALLWDAFVTSEAEHCASLQTPPEKPVVPIDPWKAAGKRRRQR